MAAGWRAFAATIAGGCGGESGGSRSSSSGRPQLSGRDRELDANFYLLSLDDDKGKPDSDDDCCDEEYEETLSSDAVN